ncbi:sensor histidine kinase [Paenibacillus sp. y28]|uniref:sensor histidine kinase n=1 Tax=Paenibacillus sp. y28 TaxID=3129110 RepID=UPI00301AD509
MIRIRRRLIFHFTYQFFFQWVFVLMVLLTGLFLLIQLINKEEIQKNFTAGALESMVLEADARQGSIALPSHWTEQLTERGYWLQVVNSEGRVVYSLNVPEGLKTVYGAPELLQIGETGRLDTCRVTVKLESIRDQEYLFMLGIEDTGPERLQSWFHAFGANGIVRPDAAKDLERLLEQSNEYVQIVDAEGQIVQSIGEADRRDPYQPLELLKMRSEPDIYASSAAVYYDEASGHIWLLHTIKDGQSFNQQPILHGVIVSLTATAGFALLLTLGFSFWHGYRYGQPLLLFAAWFERMGKGQYREALTDKDRKKVYRKNGAIRLRYRLYKEVIAGFYHMAERLDASEQERVRLEKTREEWMTGISHDLRTPLSTIHGYGHLLESSDFEWTDAELKEMGRTIREKGDYMLELLQDFSLTFQLKNKDVPFELTPTELNELVRRTVLRYVNDATLQHVTFSFAGEKASIMVHVNTKWLQRLLDNLITNAIKHNPPGTQITVTTKKTAQHAFILVEDNGVGMDEHTRRNLFERYYRGTNTEQGTDGAGLGMSIAKSIAVAHQGDIEVTSREGAGTTITLRLPRSA